ncbi:MAG: DUF1566 domain-containing protein [Sulfuricurvum sp.]|nr:DUF1566 domain-containing protein [Sulfuricurvum sp.]MDD5387485.1 DUF1566 domain-containing protein [Sulfuricurvum sp.]
MNKLVSSIGLVCLLFGVANAQIISKNGIAKDTVTGLIWQDNSDSSTVQKNWLGAKEYCKDLRLGEYDDWRLPNIYELSTLLNNPKSYDPDNSAIIYNVHCSNGKSDIVSYFYNKKYVGQYFVVGTSGKETLDEAANYICKN